MLTARIVRGLSAVTLVAVSLSCGLTLTASASTPPPPTEPESGSDAGQATEIVESWALVPGGGPNGEEIGTRSALAYSAAPGTVVEDSVVVVNYGNVPAVYTVYAADAKNNEDGGFDLLPGDQASTDLGSWISVSQTEVAVPPGRQAVIPITISIPLDATPGDHVAGIVASNPTESETNSGPSVIVDRRTGVRVYLRVDGPLDPSLAITDLTTTYHHAVNSLSGSADVSFTVENRGNVRIGGTPTVSIGGPLGLGTKKLQLDTFEEILPGQRANFSVRLEGVPALFLNTTTVSISPDPQAGADLPKAFVGKDRFFAPPITFLVILFAVALGVLGWRRLRGRRADELGEQGDVEREPQLQ